MFGTNSAHASGDLRARKRRCAVCGTKRMINREDGRVTCRHGHEQAGVFEESAELIVSGSTRRHVARRRRENKRRMAQSMRLYGRSAHFVIVQALQHILKLQVETLVRDLGAPEALIGAVRNIWLLYVSQLDDQDALDITYAHDQHQGSGTQTSGSAAAATATRTRHPSAFAANSLNTLSATHTYDIPPVEDSIDELLKEIDADIAEDEEDFVAWQRQDKDQTASLLDGSQEVDGGQAPGLEVPSRSAAQQLSRMSRRGGTLLVKEIKRFARIDYLPSILYLGFLWIKSSIMLGDLHYIIAEERIPYVSAYLRIPEEITLRLGQGIGRLFVVPFAPSVKKIAILATAFEKLLLMSVGVKFPQQTLPFQMIMLLKRLALPIEIYPMVMRAVELGGDVVRAKTKKKGVTFIAMAAIIVCLKLHYGLDEIERKPSGPDSESKLNLPPLDKFLEAWRDDWESEMSIGSIPYMTAYGQNWPTIFAEHYKRLVSSHGTRRTRAVYDDISRRYRSAIDTLAASDRVDSLQTAQPILPYEYHHRYKDLNDPLGLVPSKTGRKKQARDQPRPVRPPPKRPRACVTRDLLTEAEIEKCILPVSISAVYSKGARKALDPSGRKRPSTTIVQPFKNHGQIQLEHGEKSIVLYSISHSNTHGGGYTMPLFGLIISRCAMILGCTAEDLIRLVTSFEYNLIYGTRGKDTVLLV